MNWQASNYLIVACWIVVFVLRDQTPCTNAGLYLLTNANVNGNFCRVLAEYSALLLENARRRTSSSAAGG